ncbi:flagellar hook-basal body protein [Paenibacillus sp. S33]|uniref:Flagellar hook-basal body protein n=1 Tax=Paenibacillus peoriae TaxID=59893 RepID=A0A7H0Y7T5_9BACL|nr:MULTISPECIES: flagellar hook-basal body protein [Paenibacillus]KOS04360.1 flagellar basal body rod protein [Paenibacillus polymyxa]PNQ82524.1 flagellar basal body rod protein [Paenibacillus sp. F4]QNR67143.1 flagellar hook-basal body protein [Paenibacillus peoriae]
MLRGLYTAAAGLMTQQRRHDTVTQNIANMNTTGYKQENSVQRSFPEMLISMTGGNPDNPDRTVGKLNTGVFAEESLSPYIQGALKDSGQATDFAIQSNINVNDPATGQPMAFDQAGKFVNANGEVTYRPEAFFSVRDSNGNVRYTRDGHFQVNGAGALLSSTGSAVLDTNGKPIQLTGAVSALKVNERGELVDSQSNQTLGTTLGISVIDRPYQLVREGNGNFRLNDTDGATARMMTANDAVSVRQGYLEVSNVDASQSMVDMMAALRAYEANQKVIQFYDKSLDKAVNEVGRV